MTTVHQFVFLHPSFILQCFDTVGLANPRVNPGYVGSPQKNRCELDYIVSELRDETHQYSG